MSWDAKFIKWTAEREAFLERTVKAIQEISNNLGNFINKDNLELRIDKMPMLMPMFLAAPKEEAGK